MGPRFQSDLQLLPCALRLEPGILKSLLNVPINRYVWIYSYIYCKKKSLNHPHLFAGPGKPPQMYYLHPNCYLLGTIDRSRSPGIDLAIQQRFRWVHFRNDQEPMKTLLHRHLFRRLLHKYRGTLPPPDDMVSTQEPTTPGWYGEYSGTLPPPV